MCSRIPFLEPPEVCLNTISLFMLHYRTAYYIYISREKDAESHYFLHKHDSIPTIGFVRKMFLHPYYLLCDIVPEWILF